MSETLPNMSARLEVDGWVDVIREARHSSWMRSIFERVLKPSDSRICANDAGDVYVDRAIAAMRADPKRRWTVASLARVAGLSRAPFARRFRQATGLSPLRWLLELRLRIAQARLLEEDSSLATIAIELGYSSEFAFSKAFKRLLGIAPGRFRRVVLQLRPRATPQVRAAA